MKRIQPSVVIGLGGTGVDTITFLKKTILEQAPDIARFVRFLAVDIDELKGEVPSGRLFGENIRLDPDKNEFFHITDQTTGAEARNIPAVSSWFPPEGYRYLPLTEGARQAKPIGRLGFFLSHEDLARRLFQLCDGLVTPDVLQQFPGLQAGTLNIYIVSSICGGTGAGLFVDVAYELRFLHEQAHLPQKTRIKGLFAMGDIYDAVSKRVLANTYASLREINWIQRESSSFHPLYPDVTRDVITRRPFDALYLFSDSNASDIEFSSPIDFAHLCSDFIFLDSGADARADGGDPLSQMMQSTRNNAEVYTMNYDADGTPRCFSSLGLCKLRFPAMRVAELCAARLSLEIINHHILGRLSKPEILEARRKAQDFLSTEGMACDENSSDLPDRMIEKDVGGGDHITLDRWVTQSLAQGYRHDLDKMKDLEVGRFTNINNALQTEIKQFQDDMAVRVVDELYVFQGVLEKTIARMFKENLGVSFVSKFLDELLEIARASRDYAQQELKSNLGQEKRLGDQMNTHIREMANLLGRGMLDFLRGEARRAQLKEAYKGIRLNFLNKVNVLKMRAAIAFYDGVFNVRQQLMEGGEGALSILSRMVNNITLIQAFVGNLTQAFGDAYEDNKIITSTPFEILIYDNEYLTELEEVYGAVYSDGLRANLFEVILEKIGGSIWHLRELIDDAGAEVEVRTKFMDVCVPPFTQETDRKTVAQRIFDAKRRGKHPKDYGPNLQIAYDLANCFCRLNDTSARWADLRPSEQTVSCVVAYQEEEDAAWKEVEKLLRESMGRAGRGLPLAHSSDRHAILIYREYCGFPAYTLRRISSYHNNYNDEARRDNAPPLQMLTKTRLEHIHVPTKPVLGKYEILALEALALGIIMADQENYYLLTADEWRRRKLAEEAQKKGEMAKVEDRTAGSDRYLGSTLTEVYGRLREKIPPAALMESSILKYEDQVGREIEQRKATIEPEMLLDLFEALYFEGYEGTERERLDLENVIRPSVAFVVDRDFALNRDNLHRPSKTHQELLKDMYL